MGEQTTGGQRAGRTRRLLTISILAGALSVGAGAPAHAGLLDGALDLVTDTAETTTGVVDDAGAVLLGDEWLVEDSVVTSMKHVTDVIGANRAWREGYTGRGVDVALIDTGVVPVPGLSVGPVVNGADLSVESQSDHHRYLDTYGHGTHLGGIIAGRSSDGFRGVAPDARLVSLKLASADGATDVSQVIAALDWVVEHRNDAGLNVRVVNLAYGTNSTQDHLVDPLMHAVENAWRSGIVVVVSGGNDGPTAQLSNPALDPYVIAVGAGDTRGTAGTSDDQVAAFSSGGSGPRRVDLVAPGRSIASLRNPGSYIDVYYPEARVGETLFKGSGTSQAAAAVTGAVAILLQHRPSLQPDQVKALLRSSASSMPYADAARRGAGMLNVWKAVSTPTPTAHQTWAPSTGTGSIEASRGDAHIADGDVELRGEQTVLGPFDSTSWAAASSAGTAWSGGSWIGQAWTGDCWCGTSWTPMTWSAAPWTGTSWAGMDWQGRSWKGEYWDGRSWKTTDTWSGSSWKGSSWKGSSWKGSSWKGAGWFGGSG